MKRVRVSTLDESGKCESSNGALKGDPVIRNDKQKFHRNFHMLHAHASTFHCATVHQCIPCLYKFFPDGSAFGLTLPPNQRPEMCKRSDSSVKSACLDSFYPRTRHHPSSLTESKQTERTSQTQKRDILTVGDGDFSFSLSLAQSLDVDNFVATSYESRDSVLSVYKHSDHNITKLKQLGVEVKHVVDGKNIQGSLSDSKYHHRFDFIVWNFPCIRITGGADAQVADIEENKDLVQRFFFSARQFLRKQGQVSSTSCGDRGEIHVTHKTFEPFCWWDILSLAAEAGLVYRGSMVFDRYLYPGYVNRKALDNKSFPFLDAQTYVFTEAEEGQTEGDDILTGRELMVSLGDPAAMSALEKAIREAYDKQLRSGKHARKSGKYDGSSNPHFKKKKMQR